MIFQKQVEQLYRSNLYIRNDNPSGIFYFSPEDFPGLQAHAFAFTAKAGHTLNGYFYHYGNPIPGRLLVFDHGMGNGHRAYMREIEKLAKAGFLVFSYDHTGCMASGGANTNGFAQSLSDLDACLRALKALPELHGRSISVMGHSWGGFSTMNITALHPDITHVVSMSGFISVKQIVDQNISGILKGYREGLYAIERQANPDYVDYNAVESLKDTSAKVLLIYSSDDKIVNRQMHYDPLVSALSGKDNIRFLLVDRKNHNPSYTADAVAYKDRFWAEFSKQEKKKLLKTPEQQQAFMAGYDWWRMTEQDDTVWNVIIEWLNSGSGSKVQYQAHRGVSTEYPENTIPAIEAAAAQGYHIVELDPKFTRDNVCVLLHDRTLNRTCRTLSGELLSEKMPIADLNYEDLKQYDAGIFMGEQFKGTPIPLLRDAVARAKELGIPVKIDNVFATYPMELQQKLFDEVEAVGGDVSFTCGNLQTVETVLRRFPTGKIHYDGVVDEEILLQLRSLCKNNDLTVWIPMKNDLTSWVKIPTATKEMCDLVKRHARLGLWIIETDQQLAEATKLGADIIETTGALKP